MTLGERIKEQRNKNGFSQEKIAEFVGISRQAVTKWEAGQSIPSMANLISLAELFGVSLSELTGGGDDSCNVQDASTESDAQSIDPSEKPVKPKTGIGKLIAAIILAVLGILTVTIVSNMSSLVIMRLTGVSIHATHLLRLGFQVGSGMAIFAAIVLFVLYIKGPKTVAV
ncbi:MAG: helix-turn-helix domain-containing protein [Oscillospiraceae bacterium]|nr:helix-turn-helix domain-containing protein [Oscillospiraceae bacterium]